MGMSTAADNPASKGTDRRWDGRIPWYLRYPRASIAGEMESWLDLVGRRLERFFMFNEAELSNDHYFGSCLESETLGYFKYAIEYGATTAGRLKGYFDFTAIRQQAEYDCNSDVEEAEAAELSRKQRLHKVRSGLAPPPHEEVFRAEMRATNSRAQRLKAHQDARIAERVETLEAVFRTVMKLGGKKVALDALVADLRRACAAKHVPLDIRGHPPLIVPIEEQLLQQNVIEPLLTRLAARWPDRANELIGAYHDMLTEKPPDEVFGNAFKTVEEIARSLTGDSTFEFSDADLKRWFPTMHSTIKTTISKLRAHRGDAAAHGRKAPTRSEIRYLLFHLCNTALLLLDSEALITTVRRMP
jgi:hypothetical protein